MIDVVVRCRNSRPELDATLDMLARQTVKNRVHLMNNASTDGSAELAASLGAHVVPIVEYHPAVVLNTGMAITTSDVVVFLNADATPVDEHCLEFLLQAMAPVEVAAAFARQSPRSDAHPLVALDMRRMFGDDHVQKRFRHAFSMVCAAIRRSVWQQRGFNETFRISEDIEWTWWARQAGFEIAYAHRAHVVHSNRYCARAWWRRSWGEGEAEARIFTWSAWDASLLRYTLLPLLRQMARDAAAGLLLPSIQWRPWIALARRAGFVAGRTRRS